MRAPDARAARHLLVTGGAGFIGSEFVRQELARDPRLRVTVLDKLTYAGNRANLSSVDEDPGQRDRLTFVVGDIADPAVVGGLMPDVDAVVNFAAESHVDRSILDPEAFLHTGVIGVHVLLEAVKRESGRTSRASPRPVRFVQVSTDEVYGSVDDGIAAETAPLRPRSPYAAAKAAGELLAHSYHVTHGVDVVVTRGCNTYGPFQHPEKLIPLFLTNALDDRPLPMYGDGLQRRDWMHVSDHAAAVALVLERGEPGGAYNLPANQELTNRAVIELLLDALGKPWSLVRTVEDRQGHDRRYAMSGDRITALGWKPTTRFEEGIRSTAEWYVANEPWWRQARSGSWDAYYERQYGARLAVSTGA